MKPVSVNFSARRERPYDHAGWVLLVAAVGASLFLAWYYAALVRMSDAREARLAHLQRPASGAAHALSAGERGRLRPEMRFARHVIEQLDTPWPALFSAVEAAYDEDVALLGVEPEPGRREVRLLAEAKDAGAMLAYIRQVRQSPVLKGAWLVSHQVNLQDPLHPVRFTVSARWLPPPVGPSPGTAAASGTREAAADAGPQGGPAP
jgi:hypothetical protein